MAISTEPRPSIIPPIAPLPVEPPTEQPMQPAARPWADGTTALLIDHVTKRFKLGRKKPTVTAVEDVTRTAAQSGQWAGDRGGRDQAQGHRRGEYHDHQDQRRRMNLLDEGAGSDQVVQGDDAAEGADRMERGVAQEREAPS